MPPPFSVCVIGGGPQGLAALKNLIELNGTCSQDALFEVELLESRQRIGGIWSFSEDPSEITALRNTVQNTSRFRNCFSDFPVKDAWIYGGRSGSPPVYLTQQDTAYYLQQYARKFKLMTYIRFNSRVSILRRDGNDSMWEVELVDSIEGKHFIKSYDKVIVATGQHHDPMVPHTEGIENFKGKALHALKFKSNEPFIGQNVLVIGSSNSAGDVATELAGAAKQVLISRRRGVIISPRFSQGTYRPNDVALTRRFDAIAWALTSIAPVYMTTFIAATMKSIIGKALGARVKPAWNLNSEHAASITFQAPMVTDTIIPLLEAGKVKFVPGVRKITDDGRVEFQDGRLVQVDAIVYCTGYSIDEKLSRPVQRSGELQLPRLYHNIYHPEYPHSLAYLTFWFTIAGITELGDLAAMGIAQVFLGHYRLPSRSKMEAHIDGRHKYVTALAERVQQPISKQSAARCVDRGVWVTFLHEVAGTDVLKKLGYGFQGWRFWWQNPQFCKLLMTGVNSIHVSRLFDGRPGSRKRWDGARRAIIEANEDLQDIENQMRARELESKS